MPIAALHFRSLFLIKQIFHCIFSSPDVRLYRYVHKLLSTAPGVLHSSNWKKQTPARTLLVQTSKV